jgi:hypothetical protein
MISRYFGRADSEIDWGVGSYVKKLSIMLSTNQSNCELMNKLSKFGLNLGTNFPTKFRSLFASFDRYIMEEEDELKDWMKSAFTYQLDPENYTLIYETLRANFFTTRLKLKLIQEDALDMMFSRLLPLGAKAVLTYQLQRLREESPLISLKSKRHEIPKRTQSSTSEEPKRVSAYFFLILNIGN